MKVTRITQFFTERRFEKVVKDLGPSSAAEIFNTVRDFKNEWLAGLSSDDLNAQFTFKPFQLKPPRKQKRPYKLYEIYAGPNRKHLGYRVVIMFYDNEAGACWVHAFKKQKQSDPAQVALAIARADEYWNYIKGG